MKRCFALPVFLVAFASSPGVFAQPNPETIRAALDAAKVTIADALTIAQRHFQGGTPLGAAIRDRPEGGSVIEIEMLTDEELQRVEIDAASGKLRPARETELDAIRRSSAAALRPLVARAKLSPMDAAKIAVATIAGSRLFGFETERWRGAPMYEFWLLSGERVVCVEVHAVSGDVLEVDGKPPERVDPNGTLVHFDNEAVGKLPEGWKAEGTNQKGLLALWEVGADPSATSAPNVLGLAKINHDWGGTYNICWTDRIRFDSGAIEVRFKAVSGKEDQGGGVIWRVKDKDNYMVARLNPLEENFRVYYVKDGDRKQLASAKVTIPAGEWHLMRVEQEGTRVKCFLDGALHLEATDNHVQGEGGVGVWTKADAVTSFDDLKVLPSRK